MDDTNDVQALEKISSEVDESQIKVILSSQCIKVVSQDFSRKSVEAYEWACSYSELAILQINIKTDVIVLAQAFLLDKLKKQAERHKETCGFISSANLRLEAEIKQAEQEINSMLIAHDTIKLASVELKKELLLAQVKKADITERIEEGKKKYEDLWQTCKARYESIPFVQKLLRATETVKAHNNDIDGLDKQIITLFELMKTQRENCINLDIKRCIELADYMVNEMPKSIKIITEKSGSINDLTKQLNELIEEQNVCDSAATVAEETLNLETIETKNKDQDDDLNKSDEDALMPKLELANFDLDILDVNLERAKMKNDEIPNSSITTTDSINNLEANNKVDREDRRTFDYLISPYFNPYKENISDNYSKRKLINILEDVHINKDEVYSIVKKVNPESLRTVNEISVDVIGNGREIKGKGTPIESDLIEEVDMSCTNTADIIIPPTQFLDITLPNSQDGTQKKRVSFDIPSSIKIDEITDDVDKQNDAVDNEAVNQTINSQLDTSVVSDDSFMKIQDMILKQHNLDLSPQFVYAKNPVLQKRQEDKIVTSNFFQNDNEEVRTDKAPDYAMEMDEEPQVQEPKENLKEHGKLEEVNLKDNMLMDVDEIIVSSPKEKKKIEEPRPEKPLSGLLFTHGAQAIPDSLNASMSTTGYDDSDFPHCIDSSLLLSPKADIPMTSDNPDVQSQEVPNFLSGLRKAGLSFFGGGSAPTDSKPDSSAPNEENSFSFNFGGEKKNRGGLFSLFN